MAMHLVRLLIILAIGFLNLQAYAQTDDGTLVVDLKPFTSEIKLKKKVKKQLESGGMEWGLDEGQLVISLVSKKFVNFDLPMFTRFGTQETLDIPPGTYRVTCIGYFPEGGLRVETVLKKGAFFNLDILTFEVRSGEVTTLEIQPIIEKHSSFFVKAYMPALVTRVVENDSVASPEVVLNERTDTSIAWEEYGGSLKFRAGE